MKRFLLTIFTVLYMICTIGASAPNYEDDRNYSNFAGRLYISSVGVDVALYNSFRQYVVDREDSAAYFDIAPWQGHMVIGDHNTQGFDAILDVEIGAIAMIVGEDGSITYYECVDAFNGHNTGRYISDWNGKIVMHRADLLMYTCLDYYKNVRVVLWNKIEEIPE